MLVKLSTPREKAAKHMAPLSTEALAGRIPSTEPVRLHGTTAACTIQGPTVVLRQRASSDYSPQNLGYYLKKETHVRGKRKASNEVSRDHGIWQFASNCLNATEFQKKIQEQGEKISVKHIRRKVHAFFPLIPCIQSKIQAQCFYH